MSAQCKQPSLYKVAFGAALVSGCLAAPSFAHAGALRNAQLGDQELPAKKVEAQVAVAEGAVLNAPQDATARSRLGHAYLGAGRFISASASFEDAVALGDHTPATALGMALSYIATGRNGEAGALLEQWRSEIPAGDHGLALALCGQPAQAIAVLGAAIAQGDNTPTMRQNLAYAYALSGYLREARMIASQDVPADRLDARVSEWALAASLGSNQLRVAALIGAPMRSDPGRAAQFALAVPASNPAFAAVDAPAERALEAVELPALVESVALAPQMAFVTPPSPHVEGQLPASVRQPSPEVADIAAAMRRYKDTKAVQARAMQVTPPPRKSESSAVALVRVRDERRRAAVAAARSAPTGGHVVQLGSFTTDAGARRAWAIFVARDPSLKNRELRITQAMVNGRRYFRVAAGGYGATEARRKCSSLKGRGTDCLAVADATLKRGPVPLKALAPKLART